tara:strand:+ start:301 stop:816 length:516 start_codon:yes stop_codon:yes gene_type:complete
MKKNLLFISQDKEIALIQEMIYKIQMSNPDIHPSKTCFLCVSPDYSSVVCQHLSHALSVDGEIYHIEAVNVPFPDESEKEYAEVLDRRMDEWLNEWESFVLIEAGVIRGGNYTWTTDIMKKKGVHNYKTVALCENIKSKFQSDFVSLYYDNDTDDLHFWWERPNNHWQFYS